MLSELSLVFLIMMSIRAEFARLAAREYITRVVITEFSPKMGKIRFATPAIKIIAAARAWIPMKNILLSFPGEARSKLKGTSCP